MEGMLSFVSFIFIVFGILQIILFFKIWGMTTNVKKIADKFCQENTINEPISLKQHYEITDDNDTQITIGDHVIRKSDQKEMIVDRIIHGKYGCADPNTNAFISGYNRNEICKI